LEPVNQLSSTFIHPCTDRELFGFCKLDFCVRALASRHDVGTSRKHLVAPNSMSHSADPPARLHANRVGIGTQITRMNAAHQLTASP
jgi:hypothetical protein